MSPAGSSVALQSGQPIRKHAIRTDNAGGTQVAVVLAMKHLHYALNQGTTQVPTTWAGTPLCSRLTQQVTNDPHSVTCRRCKRAMQAAVKVTYEPPALSEVGQIVLLRRALQVLVDHASEAYPHFESPRGQRDIEQARHALGRTK